MRSFVKAVAGILGFTSSVAMAGRANVVVILADDLGYADIGAQSIEKDVRTPNIDSIANEGVRFTQGYVSCPVCSPSRAGILTGRYQERFGHEWNPAPGPGDHKYGLSLDQTTIANEMKRIGYVTGALGKWHEGDQEKFLPLQRGFDEFFGFVGGMHGYMNMRTPEEQGVNCIRRGNDPIIEKEYLTDAISREAVSFIDRHSQQPFFLYVAYNAVHVPQQSPPKYLKRFADVQDHKRKMMLAMLSAEDDGVGQILYELHNKKLNKDTLVVFLSDNGGPTAEDGCEHSPAGFKGQVWEGGIRIPFMAKWPGHIPAGHVVDQPVISLDLFPTALAAADTKPQKGLKLDGVNILPLMENKSDKAVHPILYWRFTPQWAIRDGDYKLEKARDGITRLYDLKKDVSEKMDLMTTKPELAEKLQVKFNAWNAQLMAPQWPGRQEGANDAARVDYEESLASSD